MTSVLSTPGNQMATNELRFIPHMPADLVWKQYGAGIVAQYPEKEWEKRVQQVPPAYQDYIRERISLENGAVTAKEGQGDAKPEQALPE